MFLLIWKFEEEFIPTRVGILKENPIILPVRV